MVTPSTCGNHQAIEETAPRSVTASMGACRMQSSTSRALEQFSAAAYVSNHDCGSGASIIPSGGMAPDSAHTARNNSCSDSFSYTRCMEADIPPELRPSLLSDELSVATRVENERLTESLCSGHHRTAGCTSESIEALDVLRKKKRILAKHTTIGL